MFRGKKCSERCKNSINILQRQKAAEKLQSCYCQGDEDFDCNGIKRNMEELCFAQDNEIDTETKPKTSASNNLNLHKYLLFISLFFSILVQAVRSAFEALLTSS